jgi:FkbM family methyltransferase
MGVSRTFHRYDEIIPLLTFSEVMSMSLLRRAYYKTRRRLTLTRKNVRDVLTLGWGFHLRYAAILMRKTEAVVSVRNVGKLRFRLTGSDTETIREIFSLREYDLSRNPHFRDLMKKYDKSIKSGLVPTIIDAGANMGAATVWFSRQFPAAHIIAIEPDSDNARVIRENVAQLTNVTLVEGAIGADSGFVSLENTETESNAIRTVRHSGDCGVRVYTVDDLLKLVDRATPFIFKIDIEGFERDLFSKNTDWVSRPDVIIVEPHDWLLHGKQTSAGFQKALGDIGSGLFLQGQNLVYINKRVWEVEAADDNSKV